MNLDAVKKLQKKLKPFLLPLSFAYGTFLTLRDVYYLNRPKKTFEETKIISVGNIVAGGVGKTPLVIELAKFFKTKGKTTVITNNYPLKDKQIQLVSVDGSIFKKPPKVSDEPYMIAKKADVNVIASKNREAAIELALGLKSKFIILDDALHKRNIKKDLEICVLDKYKPFGDGLLLPAGTLRDTKRALNLCDLIVCVDKGEKTEKQQELLDCIDVKMEVVGVFDKNRERIDARGKTALAFCGIGNPESFKNTLENLGVDVKKLIVFEDHHIYTQEEIKQLKKEKGDLRTELLITTFKDFVKMENESDIVYVDIKLNIESLKDFLEGFMDEQKDI